MSNKLRVLRAERRWSQSDLAAAVGVSRQAINSIENGKYDPSLSLAFRIANVFGQSVEQVFRAAQSPEQFVKAEGSSQ